MPHTASSPPSNKRLALAALCSRASHAVSLLDAIEGGKIAGTELTADLVRQLQYLNNDEVAERLKEVWGDVRETAADKLELIASYKQLIESASPGHSDQMLGRAVFAKTCQRCHVLYGLGNKVGPDLTGSNRGESGLPAQQRRRP